MYFYFYTFTSALTKSYYHKLIEQLIWDCCGVCGFSVLTICASVVISAYIFSLGSFEPVI